MMSAMSRRRQFPVVVPGRIAELSAIMLEYISDTITQRPPNGTAEGVRIALAASDLSIGKARNELGYSPRPIEPVLRETITHLLARNGQQPSGAIEHHALSSRAS
jgi:dihydroflavonol-4-reductase